MADRDFATSAARPTVRAALFVGFGVICAIWLVAGYFLTSRMDDVEGQSAAVSERYMRAQELLTTVRSQVLLESVYVRDALLDPVAGLREFRPRVENSYRTAERALGEYVPVLDEHGERERIGRLEIEINAFRKTLIDVLESDSHRWPAEARTLLRHRVMPKRESAIRIVEDMQMSNRAAFVQQQNDVAAIYRTTQRRLWQSFGLAVLASLAVGLIAVAYVGQLERRIDQQRMRERDTARDLQRLSSQLITAQEEERRTIARELHDEVGQALTALKVELVLAERTMAAEGISTHALDDARRIADGTLHTVRDLSHLLHPAMLDDLGLAAAADWLLKGVSKRHDVRVELVTDRMDIRLDGTIEAAAYRIIQEAVTNVVKHASARSCRVALRRFGDMLHVTIEDDGCGFDPSAPRAAHGLGLIGIRERASQLGGTMHIDSGRDGGTRVTVELPSRRPAAAAEPQRQVEAASVPAFVRSEPAGG